MRTGKRDYDQRHYDQRNDRGRDGGANDDERGRGERWHDDGGRDDHVRNSLRPETDDDYRRGGRGGYDEGRHSGGEEGRLYEDGSRRWYGAEGSGPLPDRARQVRGERDRHERDRHERDRHERDRHERDRYEGARYERDRDDDARGRAAFGRDEFGRDEYGAYGEAMPARGENHAGKGPKGWQRSDERIRDDVSEALARHAALDASGIEVEVDGGEVKLTGTVADRRTKRLAEDLVERIFAVRDVQNHLRVQREGSRTQHDGSDGSSNSSSTATSGTIDARQRSRGNAGASSSTTNAK